MKIASQKKYTCFVKLAKTNLWRLRSVITNFESYFISLEVPFFINITSNHTWCYFSSNVMLVFCTHLPWLFNPFGNFQEENKASVSDMTPIMLQLAPPTHLTLIPLRVLSWSFPPLHSQLTQPIYLPFRSLEIK